MIFFQIIFYFMYNIDIILCAYIYKKRSLWICVQQNFIFFCSYTNIQPSTSNILYVLQNCINI